MFFGSVLRCFDLVLTSSRSHLPMRSENVPLLYDVADKNYLSNVLKERAYREIAEELNMTGSVCVKCTINLPNPKL